MSDQDDGRWPISRRQAIVSTASIVTVGAASALSSDPGDGGVLRGGSMALDKDYKLADSERTLYQGPDSAKDAIDGQDGDRYEAVDTGLTYYWDGGWQSLGVGSSGNKAPASYFQSLTTEGLTFGTPTEVRTASELANSGAGTDADPYLGAIENAQSVLPDGSRVIVDGICEPENPPINHSSPMQYRGVAYNRNAAAIRLPDGANTNLLHLNNGFGIDNLTIIGNKANQTQTSHCVVLKSRVVNSWVNFVSVVEANGDGWRHEDEGFAWQVRGLYSENHVGHGFNLDGATGGKLTGTQWYGGYLYNNDRGFNCDSGGFLNGTAFHGISVVDNSDDGMHIENSQDYVHVIGEFDTNGDRGLYAGSSAPGVVAMAAAKDNDTTGVELLGNGSVALACLAKNNNRGTGDGNGAGVVVGGSDSRMLGCVVRGATSAHSNALVVKGAQSEGIGCVDVHGNGTFVAGGCVLNGETSESANAETPQESYPPGALVRFTDSGDATGDGTYLITNAGNAVKLSNTT